MIQTEKMILGEIMRLLKDLENAAYGETKANGLIFPPNLSRFYYRAKKLYEIVDELVERFDPKYVTHTDYKFICESQRYILLYNFTTISVHFLSVIGSISSLRNSPA